MSLVFNQKITLDLTISRVQNVHCSQDDVDSRNILITLSDNGKPYSIPSEVSIFLKISKPDNTYVYIDEDDVDHLFRNDDGTISVILPEQATVISGICESEIQLINTSIKEVISTAKFNIIVKKSVLNDKEIESSIDSNIVKKMIYHLVDFMNPHKVNKEQVGLGNVSNVTTNDQTPTYTEATKFENISSGEKLSIAFGKIQKAISTLISHMTTKATTKQEGHVKLTDSVINDSIDTAATPNSVKITYDRLLTEEERAKKAEHTIQDQLDKNKPIWDDKYTKNEIDNKISTLETNIDWKEAVDTYNDIATTYPTPDDGWTVNVKDTDYTYRYNGTKWITISANAIPKATQSVDGLLSKEDKTHYDDANSKKHTHSNKSVLDGITSTLVATWNKVSDKLDKTGDASNVTNTITTASSRINLSTGEKLSLSLGKISKWFSDLKTVAFSGSYNDLSNKPTSLPANGGDSTTAIKLKTARKINGIAFDGTSDITIEASKKPTELKNEDLNDYKGEDKLGNYYSGGNNNVKNKPTGIDAFGLEVNRVAVGYYKQLLTGGNNKSGRVFVRVFDAQTWSAWKEFYSELNPQINISGNAATADNAKKVNGHSVNSDVPNNAVFTDTTYKNATITTDGLMSAEDKKTFERLKDGSVTGIKGNSEKEYRTGDVNLTAENIGIKFANNLTTTEEGFLLDARQGKALSDSISTLNSSLEWKLLSASSSTSKYAQITIPENISELRITVNIMNEIFTLNPVVKTLNREIANIRTGMSYDGKTTMINVNWNKNTRTLQLLSAIYLGTDYAKTNSCGLYVECK